MLFSSLYVYRASCQKSIITKMEWKIVTNYFKRYSVQLLWSLFGSFFEAKSVWWPWHWSAGQCVEGLQLLAVCVRPDREWQVILHGWLRQQQGHRASGMRGALQGHRGKATAGWQGWGLPSTWHFETLSFSRQTPLRIIYYVFMYGRLILYTMTPPNAQGHLIA